MDSEAPEHLGDWCDQLRVIDADALVPGDLLTNLRAFAVPEGHPSETRDVFILDGNCDGSWWIERHPRTLEIIYFGPAFKDSAGGWSSHYVFIDGRRYLIDRNMLEQTALIFQFEHCEEVS